MTSKATFRVGDWTVNRLTGELSREGASVRLEERTLRLLVCLADHAGEVLSSDELLTHAWPGVVVSPDSLYQAITALRRQLGDDARKPSYIVTVPRRGYRFIAPVNASDAASIDLPDAAQPAKAAAPSPPVEAAPRIAAAALLPGPRQRMRRRTAIALCATLAAAGLAAFALRAPGGPAPGKAHSIAVLPFLDLTDDMNEEPFADGVSEELITKLSKQPGVVVAPPGASYYYKNKHEAAAEVARALHVAYVLDGSVRKSGSALRIAARLTRAADGFVVWSDSYDRTPGDKLAIQSEIATAVSQSAAARIQ
jgi:TolB-like protein/DNA-binding winged helix-turn-helix (wHTH) protein